jgi:hypothetical protein
MALELPEQVVWAEVALAQFQQVELPELQILAEVEVALEFLAHLAVMAVPVSLYFLC